MKSSIIAAMALLLVNPAATLAEPPPPQARTVSVTGYAEAKLSPDQAVLLMNVHTENRQLAAAKAEQDKKVKQMMAIAEDNGVKKEDIRTHYAAVNPIYDHVEGSTKPRFRAYGLDNRIEITLKDIEKTGPLVDKLVEAGFDRIENVQFNLSNDRQRREELLALALANAKSKAERMVGTMAKVGRPVNITEAGASTPPPMPMYAKSARLEMAQAADASMPSYTPSGLIEISQTVNATFELE